MACISAGWAEVDASSWAMINDELEEAQRIAHCRTWGEFAALGSLDPDFVELARKVHGIDDEPDATTPFSLDPRRFEGYDREDWLMRATMDLLESIGDDQFPWEGFVVLNTSAFVPLDQGHTVANALRAMGHHVTVVHDTDS